jgi:hypothetical protein
MKNRKAKIAAAATVLGLGGLGGVALGTNHGMPSAAQQGSGGAPLVTSASGAGAAASQQTAVANESTRPPIVTRASGGVSGLAPEDD